MFGIATIFCFLIHIIVIKRFINWYPIDMKDYLLYIAMLSRGEIFRLNARHSLVVTCTISKGTKLTRGMLAFKRCGTEILPEKMKEIIGQ